MSGWDARTRANVILTGIYVLFGLALLLWRSKPGRPWWNGGRLFGAAIVILAPVFLFVGPAPTQGGLISHGIVMTGLGLWLLFSNLWGVNGPDLPTEQLRQRWRLTAGFILYGGTNIAFGLTIPK